MADKRISQLIERTDIANNDVLPIVASGATTTNKVTISTIQEWMQDNLDVGVTSVGITIGSTGTDINVTGSPITTSGNITINIPTASATNRGLLSSSDWTSFNSKLSSVGLTMPSAFTVSNSPLTANGTIAVTGAGTVAQYIRGDGSLADFPEAGGGGASVSYYLNGSVSQGTIGGIAYREMNNTPILGAGTDFTINANGYIASFITDAGDPNLLLIPGGNWNFETFLSANNNAGNPTFYIELYKVDSGGTATLIASNSATPEPIAFGSTIHAYFSALAVPTTVLTLTDRLALRYYVTHSGRTITMHTEDSNLCQVITTFTTGLTALNGLTAQVQNFATGTSGTDFNISSTSATHTFNLPDASASNRGAVTTGTQTFAGYKLFNGTIGVNQDIQLATQGTALNTFIKNINATGLTSIGSNGFGFNNSNNIYFSGSSKGGGVFAFSNTGTQTYTLPDASGTVALTSDLGAYLPLAGGTMTGAINGISANFTSNLSSDSGIYSNTALFAKHNPGSTVTVNGWNAVQGDANTFIVLNSTKGMRINFPSNASFTHTLPDASGTIALTSNLGAYLPLAGGTLTGALGGTSATFSGDVQSNTRLAATNGTHSIIITPNVGSTNRIEAIGSLPLALVSAHPSITMAAGGTTPQFTLGSSGLVTLTGALNGTSASFSGAVNDVISVTSTASTTAIKLNNTNANDWGSNIAFQSSSVNKGFVGLVGSLVGNTDHSICLFGAAGQSIKFFTNANTSPRLTIDSSTGAATFSSSVTSNGSGFIIQADQKYTMNGYNSATAHITSNAGYNSNYNGVGILSNPTNANSLPAWALDLGGLDGPTIGGVADGFTISRKASGGSWASRFVINSTGNVGIGTASPQAKLHVNNGTNLNVGFNTTTVDSVTTSRISSFNDAVSATVGLAINGTPLVFQTEATERMRITSGGELFWKVTDITGAALSDGGVTFRDSTSNKFIQVSSGVSTDALLLAFYKKNGSGVTNTGTIETSGNSTLYNTTSDYRLKENVKNVEGALSKLSQLKPCTFNYISDSEKIVMGFLAHEVQEVMPQAVTGKKDNVKIEKVEISPAELDEEGNIITEAVIEEKEVPVYQGIDHSKLVPLLVAAIQEQQEQIKSLTEQINSLKNQMQ